MMSFEHLFEHGIELIERNRGEKTEAAEIYGENRNVVRFQRTGGRQQRAVAAEDDQEIDFVAHRFARDTWDVELDAALRFHVDVHFNFALVEPGNQRRNYRRDHFLDWFANDSDGSNHEWRANSNLSAAAGVEKKLLIALGSGDAAGAYSHDFQAQRSGCGSRMIAGSLKRL